MSVVVAYDEIGPCRKQLKIEVPAPAVEAETRRVVQELARRVKLPGFRKGKVPASIVQQRYKEEIERELAERLIPRYWKQAEAEKGLEPIVEPRIENVEQDGDSMVFVATVEVRPEIELSDDREYELPELEVEPSDAEVGEVVERLRRESSPWTAAERPAARGDQVELLMQEVREQGVPSPKRTVEVEVGGEGVWEELSLAVTGLEAGAESDFRHRAQEVGSDEIPRERHFQIEVVEVRERELLALDDALAQKLDAPGGLEELRDRIRQSLRADKLHERYHRRRKALLDQLRERHPIRLPEGAVQSELNRLLEDYASTLSAQGVDLERSNIDWSAMEVQAKPQAEKRVHERLLLDALARADGVEVSEQELESMLATIARSERRSTVAVRQALDRDGRLPSLRAHMRRDKMVSILLGEATEVVGGTASDPAVSFADDID